MYVLEASQACARSPPREHLEVKQNEWETCWPWWRDHDPDHVPDRDPDHDPDYVPDHDPDHSYLFFLW